MYVRLERTVPGFRPAPFPDEWRDLRGVLRRATCRPAGRPNQLVTIAGGTHTPDMKVRVPGPGAFPGRPSCWGFISAPTSAGDG